jgi:hypothetical protein
MEVFHLDLSFPKSRFHSLGFGITVASAAQLGIDQIDVGLFNIMGAMAGDAVGPFAGSQQGGAMTVGTLDAAYIDAYAAADTTAFQDVNMTLATELHHALMSGHPHEPFRRRHGQGDIIRVAPVAITTANVIPVVHALTPLSHNLTVRRLHGFSGVADETDRPLHPGLSLQALAEDIPPGLWGMRQQGKEDYHRQAGPHQ